MKQTKKRLLRCPEGKSCPYRNEYQHRLEYSHDDESDKNAKKDDKSTSKDANLPVVPFSGKAFTTSSATNTTSTSGSQLKLSVKRSIPQLSRHQSLHHLPPKRKKVISTTTTSTKKTKDICQKASKDSHNFRSAVNICKEMSSSSAKNDRIIDLCQEDDDDDDEIEVIEKDNKTKTAGLMEKYSFGEQKNNKVTSNFTEDDEIIVDKIVAPPRRVFESAQTFNDRQYIPQTSSLFQHYEQKQPPREQLELERALKESRRDLLVRSQNNDYELSLQEDRLKAKKKEIQSQKEKTRIEFLKSRFQNEDFSSSKEKICSVAFRLPLNGQRVIRKFLDTSSAQELYWFVEWLKIDPNNSFSSIPDNFTLKPAFGGIEISKEDSLETLGLYPNGVVFVREKS